MKRVIPRIVLTLLLTSMFVLAFNIQHVETQETIYIRANGLVEGTDKIANANNIIYTLTGDITSSGDGIIVERDNIIIEGDGHTIQGSGAAISNGIQLEGRSNITIEDMRITAFWYGIRSWTPESSFGGNNSIRENNITNNHYGIRLEGSSSNNISGNVIANNEYVGIDFYNSSNTNLFENYIAANDYGIILSYYSNYNSISGNNVTNNESALYLDGSSNNTLSENNVTNSNEGIWLYHSSDNIISGNNIAVSNNYGILLRESSNNTFCGNCVTNSGYAAIWLSESSNNKIYHNDFLENTPQVSVYAPGYVNLWDDGFPSGGNYWSDYEERYHDATEIDGSGIWDTPYVIDENNQDNYPLREPFIIPEFPTTTFLLLFIIISMPAIVLIRIKPLKKAR